MNEANISQIEETGELGKGRGISVAVVDTGLEPDHPKVGGVQGGMSIWIGERDELCVSDDWSDRNGHGTACASIIRRIAPEVELFSIRIANENGVSSTRLLVEAIRWALIRGIDIVNVSLGSKGEAYRDELRDVCGEARARGTVVVAAESNDRQVSYPSALESVVTVGGSRTEGLFHFFLDPMVDRRFLGQSDRQRVAWAGRKQIFLGGTSMAAAQISGLFALLRERNRTAPVDELIALMRHYGRPLTYRIGSTGGSGVSPREISRKTLVEPLPPMRRVVLYPFSKEMHSIVRYRDTLPFEILGAMDPLGHGVVGRDAGEALGLGDTGIRVSAKTPELLSHADGIVLGHQGRIQEIRAHDMSASLLRDALRNGLHVFSFDTLEPYQLLLEEAQARGLIWTWPRLRADAETLTEAYSCANYQVDVPVLGVFGTRSAQGKFTAQLALRKALQNSGYNVGQLGTEPHSALFGLDAVFPMGYNAQLPLQMNSWIPYLRHQMLAICHHKKPEIVIVGSQSGTIPRDVHLRMEYLCLNSQLFLYGTRPDAVLLAVEPLADEDEIRYTRESIEALRILGKTEVIGLLFSSRVAEFESVTSKRTRHRYRLLSAEERNEVSNKLESTFDLPAADVTQQEGLSRMLGVIIAFFGQK